MTALTTIVGDGQMGLVLAQLLAEHGRPVRLTGPFPESIESLRASRTSRRLPELVLPPQVELEAEAERAVADAEVLVNAIPTQFIRPVWERLRAVAPKSAWIANFAKGLEVRTLLRPSEILADVLDGEASAGGPPPTADPASAARVAPAEGGPASRSSLDRPGRTDSSDPDPARSRTATAASDPAGRAIVTLSGPTIAAELARRLPAAMVAASPNEEAAQQAQQVFSGRWLRLYTNTDIIGVELAGAIKNVVALAAGMVDGLRAGCNAKSALLARGLAEIVRLGVALGARAETFFGIAGVGDLATTCFSPEGRNRTCGERLGRGERLPDILQTTGSVVEGVDTARAIATLAERTGVEMPIVRSVHAILFEGLAPRDAIDALMGRELKAERVG